MRKHKSDLHVERADRANGTHIAAIRPRATFGSWEGPPAPPRSRRGAGCHIDTIQKDRCDMLDSGAPTRDESRYPSGGVWEIDNG
jgi:hypothetical protein